MFLLVFVVDIQANDVRAKFVLGGNVSEHAAGDRVRPRWHRGADKNLGNSRVLSDSLGGVNSRQEGKLTHGAGDCNGKAKGISRLRVFLAIYDQHVFLSRRESRLVTRCILLWPLGDLCVFWLFKDCSIFLKSRSRPLASSHRRSRIFAMSAIADDCLLSQAKIGDAVVTTTQSPERH